jgi:hypothetical protein
VDEKRVIHYFTSETLIFKSIAPSMYLREQRHLRSSPTALIEASIVAEQALEEAHA